MLFNTFEFWAFFAVVLGAFYSLPVNAGRFVLLAASYVFYMWWNPWLVSLIIFSTLVDYFAGRGISSSSSSGNRRLYLALSLTSNLGILGFFKYYDFFIGSLARSFSLDPQSFTLNIILPVGISFYTFQSMSYTIDIYRGKLEPVSSFWDFALFVSFFPQLVAGPIVRAGTFLPQLENWAPPRRRQILEGVHLTLVGLVKKTVFADQFARVADLYFANPAGNAGALSAWSGLLAFALQIFFDFSGYTDVARGCGKLLGFEFPENFRRPYLAASMREFWRRWHISLSTWLRDYLYIPLGGNRHGVVLTYRNLMITMLLGGLWHGASWNFVVWGALHGMLLLIEASLRGTRIAGLVATVVPRPLKVALTFFLVTLTWVFFRCASWQDSSIVLANLFTSDRGAILFDPLHIYLAVAALLLMLCEEYGSVLSRLATAAAWVRVPFYVLLLLLLELLSATGKKIPFVYFQF